MGGIVDGIKGFFGMCKNSPSALFAGLGENMAQGLGIGFAEQMNQVAREMQNAVPSNVTLHPLASADAGRGFSANGNGAGTVINQSIRVTTPKPLSEKEMAREFRNLSRKLAMEV